MLRSLLAAFSFFAVVSAGTSSTDLQRANTKVPGERFRGHDFEDMNRVLSSHLRANFPGQVRECSSFDVPELRSIAQRFAQIAHTNLLTIYVATNDNRKERHASLKAMQEHWDTLMVNTPIEIHHVLRDSLCHDVVMRFVHHTTEETRKRLVADPNFSLPTLPTKLHTHDGNSSTALAYQEYVAASGCQACHSRLVPLPKPAPPATCESQLTGACAKRGQLGKDACEACIAKQGGALESCTSAETTAWCDHPPACIGKDECPVWPKEFSAPFTLHATIPRINGAKCNFYYKYTDKKQVQTVDYYEKCFPFVNARTAFANKPCKLFFNPAGIYLSQPGRVNCCKFVDGVGAVPPEFLQSYTYAGSDTAPDMYGNTVQCDKWDGPQGFKYWTVGHDDKVYKNFGHDIVFQDGPTGVTWRWGNFSVTPQADSLFELPGGDCEKSCPKFLNSDELRGVSNDLYVRRAFHNHRSRNTVVPTTVVV